MYSALISSVHKARINGRQRVTQVTEKPLCSVLTGVRIQRANNVRENMSFLTGISGVCPQGGVPLRSFIHLICEAAATVSVYIVFMYNKRGRELWYLEKRGSRKLWQDLEILKAFLISLEVSFLHGLFLLFLSLETFYQRVSGSDF